MAWTRIDTENRQTKLPGLTGLAGIEHWLCVDGRNRENRPHREQSDLGESLEVIGCTCGGFECERPACFAIGGMQVGEGILAKVKC